MRIRTRLLFLLLAFAVTPMATATAQGEDPTKEIKELAKRIDEELAEIDRLLLESAKNESNQGSSAADRLRGTKERSEAVEQNIDELIEKLQDMKNQGGGGGGGQQQPQDQQQQQGQQDGQQQQGQQNPQGQQGQGRNRRDGSNPEFVDQNQQGQDQQQQGEQQGSQRQPGEQPQDGQQPDNQQGNNPQGGRPDPQGGDNMPASQNPNGATGPGQRGEGEGSWGELQSYTNFLKNRGATPKVPERYRKYWKAYIEAQRKKQ